MYWLNHVVDEAIARVPTGEILISSGASPSGVYHFGHLREVITCDAIVLSLQKRGRQARHVHVVDNLDAFRKVPVTLPESYAEYLGMPLCDIPAPDGSNRSYADYCFDPFNESMTRLGIVHDVIYQHEKYRQGFYAPAIERSLERLSAAKQAIIDVSGRQLDEYWTPVQIMENGRLKNRRYIGIDTKAKTITYQNADDEQKTTSYATGLVKIDWRLDWPGRWWLLGVTVEPFGRDHATKGGSYDTGKEIAKAVYDITAPIPVPYDFVNRTGDTKKMSASKGTGVNAADITDILPPEVVRYFMLRYPADKRLFFDETESLVKLIDDYATLLSNPERSELEEDILYLSQHGTTDRTISSIPFSHLVATHQASLRDINQTLDVISRSEYRDHVERERDVIIRELAFVDRWLDKWAPDDMKFSLRDTVDPEEFNDTERAYLAHLAEQIKTAPNDADGAWFHNCIYENKDTAGLPPRDLFSVLYRATIGKTSGPRAGYFLSLLPRDWLIDRLSMTR